MAVRNYVFRELEHANFLCNSGDCNEDSCFGKPAVHEVDEAVAFWVGSLEGADGSGNGVLMYDMAENRAEESGTVTSGLSGTNTMMLALFTAAKDAIVDADCAGGEKATSSLALIQNIPLVQTLLKYSKLTSGTGTTPVLEAERVAAAMNILPIIHACSPTDAQLIYDNTKVGAIIYYPSIVDAVLKNYDCLGVTAEDIGTQPETDDSSDGGSDGGGSSGGGGTDGGGSGGAGSSSARGQMAAASIAALLVASFFAL